MTTTTPSPTPSTIDHHVHVYLHGESLTMPSLADCTTSADCLSTIASLANTRSPTSPLRLREGSKRAGSLLADIPLPDLDRATGPVPTVIQSFDYHAATANSAALARASVTPTSTFPPNGVVLTDAHNQPTGRLIEQAAYHVWDTLSPPPHEQHQIIRAALDDFAARNIREVHDMWSEPFLIDALTALDRASPLPVAVRCHAPIPDIDHLASSRPSWQSPRLTLAGGKIFSDGTLSSRTAWLLAPYTDDPTNTGSSMLTDAEFATALRTCAAHKLDLAVHAIGDAAVRRALDVYERAGLTGADCRLRIEHAALVAPTDIPRFAALSATASMQPQHAPPHPILSTTTNQHFLGDRATRTHPFRDLLESGLTPGDSLLFSSDAPIVPPNPLKGVARATTPNRDQSICEADAWLAYNRE